MSLRTYKYIFFYHIVNDFFELLQFDLLAPYTLPELSTNQRRVVEVHLQRLADRNLFLEHLIAAVQMTVDFFSVGYANVVQFLLHLYHLLYAFDLLRRVHGGVLHLFQLLLQLLYVFLEFDTLRLRLLDGF